VEVAHNFNHPSPQVFHKNLCEIFFGFLLCLHNILQRLQHNLFQAALHIESQTSLHFKIPFLQIRRSKKISEKQSAKSMHAGSRIPRGNSLFFFRNLIDRIFLFKEIFAQDLSGSTVFFDTNRLHKRLCCPQQLLWRRRHLLIEKKFLYISYVPQHFWCAPSRAIRSAEIRFS
jgi:hypothetical protein